MCPGQLPSTPTHSKQSKKKTTNKLAAAAADNFQIYTNGRTAAHRLQLHVVAVYSAQHFMNCSGVRREQGCVVARTLNKAALVRGDARKHVLH